MKLKELFEDGPTMSTEEYDKFVTLLKQKYKNNLLHLVANPDKALWRGGEDPTMIQTGKFISYKSQQSQPNRKSLTGKSYINLIQTNSPQWKKFPPRTNSTFCTTSYDNAHEFGNPLLLIPADSINKIATCAKDWNDIEVGLNGREYEISTVNSKIAYAAWHCESVNEIIYKNDLSIPSLEQLLDENIIKSIASYNNYTHVDVMQFINMMDNIVNYTDAHMDELERNKNTKVVADRLQKLCDYFVEYFGQIPSKWFKDSLTPTKMGCYVYPSYKSAEFYETDNNEIWFSGEYLLLDVSKDFHKTAVFKNVIKSIKEA